MKYTVSVAKLERVDFRGRYWYTDDYFPRAYHLAVQRGIDDLFAGKISNIMWRDMR
jgi:hypothetical protein